MTMYDLITQAKDLRLKHALPLSNAINYAVYEGTPFKKLTAFSSEELAMGLLYADASAHHIAVIATLSIKDRKEKLAARNEVRSGIQRYCQELFRFFFPGSPDRLHYKLKPEVVSSLPSKEALAVCASQAIKRMLPSYTRLEGSMNHKLLTPLFDILIKGLHAGKQFSKLTPEYTSKNINVNAIEQWVEKVNTSLSLVRNDNNLVKPVALTEDQYQVVLRTEYDLQTMLKEQKALSENNPEIEPIKEIEFERGSVLKIGGMIYIAMGNGAFRLGESLGENKVRQLKKQ